MVKREDFFKVLNEIIFDVVDYFVRNFDHGRW